MDVLNILHIINKSFLERAEQIFNPRNAMYISKVDGMMNSALMIQRDTTINANTLYHLGEESIEVDKSVLVIIEAKQKEYFLSDEIM